MDVGNLIKYLIFDLDINVYLKKSCVWFKNMITMKIKQQ